MHGRRLRCRALRGGVQPVERDPHTLPSRARDLSLVAVDLYDRPTHADTRCFDRVSDSERRLRREGGVECPQLHLGALHVFARGSEPTVAGALCLRRGCAFDLAL